MTKFTKGPWEVYAELNVRSVLGDAVAACGPQRGLSDDGGNAENKANAALISAAPDIFNALTVLADACESMGIPVDAARAALLKASP